MREVKRKVAGNIWRGVASSIFILVWLAIVCVSETVACSCGGGGTPCQEFWRAEAVFVGTVVGSERASVRTGNLPLAGRLVRFNVSESVRGASASQAEVITGLGGGDCGYPFTHGETYIVYASRNEEDGLLYTSTCTRTRRLADAAEDIAYIRGLATADAQSDVFGRIVRRNYARTEDDEPFLPVADAELVIEGEATRRVIRSDANGDFRFAGLAPGTYKIKLRLPQGLTSGGLNGEAATIEREMRVVARGCAQTQFYLESDTRVSGRVVDATGQPVANLRLNMRGAPANNTNNANNLGNILLYAETDEVGRFEFRTVPPGDYFLGVRLLSYSVGEMPPYPRTYYPGVTTREQASRVSVREGEWVRDLELRLPPRRVAHAVRGLVVWADGRPAPGANIYLSVQEEEETTLHTTLRADENGQFTLSVYEGLTYKVSAYPQGARGAAAQSPWVDVPPTPDSPPIRLVLPIVGGRAER